ncbi:Protein CBG10971 [Caenorhabditis briggsae]|uniref:Protein CBG10971 n=1 Tax=Caenorhabditis briggsae TaxID=6238 RepID=A8XBY7_CAEBR|nr:Protein CBG10971 [Caenorhabditis briggsae]CAP30226.2 Protein CBG10971 [Caenorhabditis briggsae]
MADAVAPADPAAAAPEEPRTWSSIIFGILKQAMMFYFISTMLGKFGGGGQQKTNSTAAANLKAFPPSVNLFPAGQLFDLYMYLDESEFQFNNFDNGNLFAKKMRLKYGDWTSGPNKDGSYVFEKTFPTPEILLKNQSYYLHAFIVKTGQSPNPSDKNYIRREVVYGSYMLNKYKKKHYKKTANLLTGVSEQSNEDLAKAEIMKFEVSSRDEKCYLSSILSIQILNFWHPNISINIVDDHTNWHKGGVPPPLDKDLKFAPNGEFYHPILFFNNYWNLGADYMPINETVKELKLSVTFYPLSLFKYQMYASQNVSSQIAGDNENLLYFQMRSQWSDILQTEKEDDDSIKVALLETNPILLGITIVVSMLHTVLELLAFKNDIQFWKSRKDLVGLSVRSVLFNIFQSLIVFLYICDNETNFVVKMSVGIGLLIECWKIPKVLNVEVDRENLILGVLPRLKFSDKGSYVESDTKVYDQMAFRYLSWVLFPLLVGYAIYSIIYVEQRGWYSWVLNMLYGYLLMFGFITMTPQDYERRLRSNYHDHQKDPFCFEISSGQSRISFLKSWESERNPGPSLIILENLSKSQVDSESLRISEALVTSRKLPEILARQENLNIRFSGRLNSFKKLIRNTGIEKSGFRNPESGDLSVWMSDTQHSSDSDLQKVLFINYKLKSVAHLPWRMLTYKFINTFIDDLFAFVIKMPTLYRIGCFRDDIIFLVSFTRSLISRQTIIFQIYLYQRWIYRVDPTRMNEYGTSGEHEHGVPPPVEGSTDNENAETPAIEESKKDK